VLGSSISVYGEGVYDCKKCGQVRPDLRYMLPPQRGPGFQWNPSCPVCAGSNLKPVFIDESGQRLGQSVYAVAKKAEEDLLAGACQMHAVSMVGLRYSTIIGAGQSWHNPFTHFLDLMCDGESPILHEDGLQTRDYIFVQDVVRANMAALRKHRPGTSFYNAVSAKPTTLLTVVNELAAKFDDKTDRTSVIAPIVDNTLIPGDVRHCHTSAQKIDQDLGFSASVELTQGLDALVEWYTRKKNIASVGSRV
jgi:dTDP-L-rhamnose 4-epimerase